MITGTQCRMARAALDMSLRDLAKEVGVSHTSIARIETYHEKATIRVNELLEQFFADRRIFFGPSDGVSITQDAFSESRWLVLAALQIAVNHKCGSRDILDAKDAALAEIHDRTQDRL